MSNYWRKPRLSEFKNVSQFEEWVEHYGVEVMPDPTKRRPRLMSMLSFWVLTGLIILVLGGCMVAGFLLP